MSDRVTIRLPDDWHVHLRDVPLLDAVAPETASHFGRMLVMPNVPAIHTGEEAVAYRDRILMALASADWPRFVLPLMTIKLTHRTTPTMIREARAAGVVAAKLYPSGVTTGSDDGIAYPVALYHVFAEMAHCGMVLCIHGENPGSFILDREDDYRPFVAWIVATFPRLRVVLEHITTARSVEFVANGPLNLAASITCHHLLHSLDDVLSGGLHPHHFCYPVPKRPEDRAALIRAAMTCDRAFLGTDSAPHRRGDKESSCGCAGVFSAPVAMAVLAEVFLGDGWDDGSVARLERFTSLNGARFYGLPPNEGTLVLTPGPWTVPDEVGGVVPLWAGKVARWSAARG